MQEIRASVILPVYNGEKFVGETIESALAQARTDFEIIICDDASTDGSYDIIKSFCDRYPDVIRIVRHEKNKGVWNSIQDALQFCAGEYIFQLGHDDVWRPGYMSHMIEALDKSEHAVAVFGSVDVIEASGHTADRNLFRHSHLASLSKNDLLCELLRGNFLCASASAFRKSATRTFDFGVNNELLQDYELWLKLSLRGTFGFAPQALAAYRRHDANLSGRQSENLCWSMRRRRQVSHEVNALMTRFLLSPAMDAFLSAIDGARRPGFIKECVDSILFSSRRPSHQALQHVALVWLEHLIAEEITTQDDLGTTLPDVYLCNELYRKYFTMFAGDEGSYPWGDMRRPTLRLKTSTLNEHFNRLVESSLFRPHDEANDRPGSRKFSLESKVQGSDRYTQTVVLREIRTDHGPARELELPEEPHSLTEQELFKVSGFIEDTVEHLLPTYLDHEKERTIALRFIWKKVKKILPPYAQRAIANTVNRRKN